MPRLAYASGPAAARRRAPGRSRSRRPKTNGVALGYLCCLALAATGVLIDRFDLLTETPAVWAPSVSPDEAGPAEPAPPVTTVVRVVDGDTLDVGGERIRLANIDAPEMPPKSRCASEAEGALAATARLRSLVGEGSLTLRRTGEDRYGRTLAHVYVDQADVGDALIAAGLVRPWEGRRRSWCA
jgi:endonuclease YncB( thermonuclease family)